jgi:adenylate cyclase
MGTQKKVKFPIGVKLSLIISLLLALSLGVITVLVSYLVSADVRLTAENNNWTMNRWSADAAETILSAYKAKSLLLIRNMDALASGSWSREDTFARLSDRFFLLNPDISCIAFMGEGETASGIMINGRFRAEGNEKAQGFSRSRVSSWLESQTEALDRANHGETILFNGYPGFGSPLLIMIFPLARIEGFSFSGAAAVFFSSQSLIESVDAGDGGENHTFVVNRAGDVLVHQNRELVVSGGNLEGLAIISQARESNAANLQTLYTDGGREYFGAFQRLPAVDALVITRIESSLVFEGIKRVIARIIIISVLVLALSVFIMARYSRTISRPLKALTRAADAIEEGNYTPPLQEKTHDEIGVLTESFGAMGKGLKNFERFTNKRIVALARQGKLGRTGENRTVTICFAMIRDFELISQGMNPQNLIDLVNRFLTHIVPCVTKTGGHVDKFLTQSGVVVMALWGAAETAGSPASDAFNCIRSALMMRNALRQLNMKHLATGISLPIVKMGCGINTGEVIAGQMGSDERMEYTVIGSAVNLASRIEEPNDFFDTDILITENTQVLIGRYLVTEEMPSLEVKGRDKPLRVFSVINIKNCFGPGTMKDVRKIWRM